MTTAARDDPHAHPTGAGQVLPRPEADRVRLYRLAAVDRRDIRHRGQFAYVEAEPADGEAVKLMRLAAAEPSAGGASPSTTPAATATKTPYCPPAPPPAPPGDADLPPADATRGRGLLLVRQSAEAWGGWPLGGDRFGRSAGKLWFEVGGVHGLSASAEPVVHRPYG